MSLDKMVALLATLALVSLALQPTPVAAQDLCKGPGYYHLGCYKTTVTPTQAEAAVKQCLAAVSKPECAAKFKKSGLYMYGCATYITYSFRDEACEEAYDKGEETNPGCFLRAAYGLGKAENQAKPNREEHFTCK
ncbi:uncharacterized protein HaLaN_12641 [Haematococcus lacustris]|uniref:Uncharacterized protein n=1 Tax=Haematococcus lacustris TaxID=44745 RepID=A0A699ZAJ8_HAELA|nr:uncharacterized protein HaLaN_12641 [Haematococcus lacustris]